MSRLSNAPPVQIYVGRDSFIADVGDGIAGSVHVSASVAASDDRRTSV